MMSTPCHLNTQQTCSQKITLNSYSDTWCALLTLWQQNQMRFWKTSFCWVRMKSNVPSPNGTTTRRPSKKRPSSQISSNDKSHASQTTQRSSTATRSTPTAHSTRCPTAWHTTSRASVSAPTRWWVCALNVAPASSSPSSPCSRPVVATCPSTQRSPRTVSHT
eukprot:PhF_6_TR41285/c0_g1_i1/m.62459